jgi:hypothetical protein
MANSTIITESLTNVPGFTPPTFGAVDFGVPSNGLYSAGYKMIAFEPGKILQAQELNEIQFRMNVEQTLTNQMFANWLNALMVSGSQATSGPGWNGATPLHPDLVTHDINNNKLLIKPYDDTEPNPWFLCKTNSSGLYFWAFLYTDSDIVFDLGAVSENNYIGFSLNSTANAEYTGELVNCNTQGLLGKHPLNIKNSSSCGSGRYYLKITGITISQTAITNNFVGLVQKRSDGLYYLNNIKVKETTG